MSSQNPNTNQEEAPKAKEPVFEKMENAAQQKLHSIEDQFVSLSSQRQFNYVLGTLLIIGALTGGFGVLISLVLGILMIVQAATGNMILNNFFDSLDAKHKRWLIPALCGAVVLMLIAFIAMGLLGGE